MIGTLFLPNQLEIIIDDDHIQLLENIFLFENSRLDVYNSIICDSRDLETIILREGMMFLGKVYLYKINKSFLMSDSLNKDKTYRYISVYGIFDAFTQGEYYEKFYEKED